MRRHNRQDTALDAVAIKLAKGRVPFFDRKRVHRGDEVLIAVVIAFTRPMFETGGNAFVLKHINLGHRVSAHEVRIRAEPARGDDGGAEGCVNVHNGRKGPVGTNGHRLVREDIINATREIGVIDGGKRKRVRNLSAEGKRHARAFEIGRDEHRDVGLILKRVEKRHLLFCTRSKETGDAARSQTLDLVGPKVRGTMKANDKKLC